MRTFSILFLKGQVWTWTHTLLLCEETVITKITLILNLLVSGSRQAPLLLPTSIISAAKIPGQNLQAMFQEQGEFKVQQVKKENWKLWKPTALLHALLTEPQELHTHCFTASHLNYPED